MTTITWIRHGLTDWNVEKRAQGHMDIPLNDTGRAQARLLAARMKEEAWDLLYSSDLSRAKETADFVAAAIGLPVETDVRLREISFGNMEGTTLEERIDRWGDEWDRLPFGKEEDAAAAERGLSFIRDITEAFPGKKVLVVSHGALIGNTLKQLIPHVNTAESLHNTSVTTLRLGAGRWECELFNCVKHIVEEQLYT